MEMNIGIWLEIGMIENVLKPSLLGGFLMGKIYDQQQLCA